MLGKLMLCLVDTFGVSQETNNTLKGIRNTVIIMLGILVACINDFG